MGLQDINEELYRRQAEAPSRETRPTGFNPDAPSVNAPKEVFSSVNGLWNEDEKTFFQKYRKPLIRTAVLVGIGLTIALAVVVAVKIRQSAFSGDRVSVQVAGPSEVSGTDTSLFAISYINANRADLAEAVLELSYPENFRPDPMENMTVNGLSSRVHIGNISGNTRGKIEVRGKFHGSKGSLAYMKGVLRYRPSNASSFFSAQAQLGVSIQSSSIKMSLDAPLEVASGGVVEYRLDYTNMSDVSFERLRLKMEYPEGFLLQETDPKVSEGENVWYIGSLAPGQSGSIRVVGRMDGEKNQSKTISAHIGMIQGDGSLLSYSDTEQTTRVVASVLSIKQTVNGFDRINAKPGDVLRFEVRYRNDGPVGLRAAIVTLAFSGAALDYSKLQLNDGGAFDDVRKVVTWKAADSRNLANLSPAQEGKLSVSVPVLETISLAPGAEKNFVITSVATIDSPDIPTPTGANKIIGSNTLRVKVNSKVDLSVSGFFADATFSNSGPFPVETGKETTFTVHWRVSNTFNDVDRAIVSAYLPTGIRWTGAIAPASESLSYDERTNKIVWNIGNVPANTGSKTPVREVSFQVGVTPQINQNPVEIILTDLAELFAYDLFTDEELRASAVSYRLSAVER